MPSTALSHKVEYKNFHFELKSVDEDQGIVEGYLSTFGNVDYQKDRVVKGAFKKTLLEAKNRMQSKNKKYLWPVLWMHTPEQPIGGCLDAYEDSKGLYTKFQLDISTNAQGHPNNPLATMVFSGYKNGYIDEQSMGYKAIQKDYDGEGIRNLKECQIWEESCVTSLFAADPEAQATQVKAQGKLMDKKLQSKDFSDRYMQECLSDWLYGDFNNLVQALKGSIMDLFMIGDTPDADVLNTVLNSDNVNKVGFVQAVEAYVQKGIDLGASAYLQSQDSSNSSSSMYYMSAGRNLEGKAGRAISKANAGNIADSIKSLQDSMMAHKAMTDMHYKAINTVADDLSSIIDGVAYATGDQSEQEDAAETGNGEKSTAGPLNAPTMDEIELKKFAAWLQTQVQ